MIGEELLEQLDGTSPATAEADVIVACVGGGSNAMGIFAPYAGSDVELVGVEAAGYGLETGKHGASLVAGSPGVIHGSRTYLLQDDEGQVIEAHSVSAGLDYPGVGPEHSYYKDCGHRPLRVGHRRRGARRVPPAVSDRGHHPGARVGPRAGVDRPRGRVAGRQDGGPQPVRPGRQGRAGSRSVSMAERGIDRVRAMFAAARAENRAALLPYMTAGLPDIETSPALFAAMADAGADGFEVGIPYSDPLMDGPTIHTAGLRALESGRRSGYGLRARGARS